MPPAATVGDQTAHGSPLFPGPGSVNVLIGGKPAWRIGSDFHMCPLADPTPVGPKPHVGGTVLAGSTTVLINSIPAARMGDLIVEPGIPNVIASGVVTVLIGG